MIKNFNIFLLLESILKADDDVINILNKIKDNSIIANDLLHLINKDIKTNTNYYKLINGKNDELNFINNSQVDRLLAANEDPFQKAKNGMKIGRLARQVLEFNGSKISDVELNKFVDLWKAAIDGKDIKEENFAFVKGEDIKHWYNYEQYLEQSGTLGNSCMRDPSKSWFLNIYSNNPEVCSLLILKKDNKLIARALVWKLKKPVNGFDYYLDRIYTINDSDVNVVTDIYIDWLRKNNSIKDFKREDTLCYTTLDFRTTKVEVVLKRWHFEKYPYMDSFVFFKIREGELTNKIDDGDKDKFPMWFLQGQYGKPSEYNQWRYIKSEDEFYHDDDLIKISTDTYELKSNYIKDYRDEWIKKDEAIESDYGWIKKANLITIDGKTGPKEDTITIGDSYKEVVEEVEYDDDYTSYRDPRDYRDDYGRYGKDMDYYDFRRMTGKDQYYRTKRKVTKYEVKNKKLVFKRYIKIDDYIYIDSISCYIKKDSMYYYIDTNEWKNIEDLKEDESIRVYKKYPFNPSYKHRIDYGEYTGYDIKNFNINGVIKDIDIKYYGFYTRSNGYSFDVTGGDIVYCSKNYLYNVFKIFPIETIKKQNFDKKIENDIIKLLKSNQDYKKSLKKYESIKDKEIIQFSIEDAMSDVFITIDKIFFTYIIWLQKYNYDYVSNWDCNPEDLILPLFISGMRVRYNLSISAIFDLSNELCPFLREHDAFRPLNRTLYNEFAHYFNRNTSDLPRFLDEIDDKVCNDFSDDKELFEEYFKKNYKNYVDKLTTILKANPKFKDLNRKSNGTIGDGTTIL